MNKKLLILTATIAGVATTHASTVFLLNNTSPKTLASNESDAFVGLTTGGADNGSNNGLDQDTGGASTVLALSADDGGGAITFNTSSVSGGNKLVMDGDSMGHGNDKWGNSQNWTFSLDQTISFDALAFKTINETITLHSTAWASDADASGTNWSFTTGGGVGTFSITGTSDFTSAGSFSNVAAGTAITFGFLGSAGGGEELTSLTISVVPEPSSFALLAGCFGLTWVMLRRRA